MPDNYELMAAVQLATKWYCTELLRGSGSDRDRARAYLGQRRLFAPMVEQFAIGYSPRLVGQVPWILTKMPDRALLLAAGILNETEDNRIYDPMEGRLLFPQVNASGKFLGFVGRALPGAVGKDKYLATGVTPIFRRQEILYRIDKSRATMEALSTAIVVEGLLDAVLMFQVGIRNVVATGTKAMSDPQAQILQRYVKDVEVMFDNDPGGMEGYRELKRRRGGYFAKVEWKSYPAKFKDPAEWVANQIDWAIANQQAAITS